MNVKKLWNIIMNFSIECWNIYTTMNFSLLLDVVDLKLGLFGRLIVVLQLSGKSANNYFSNLSFEQDVVVRQLF